MRHTKFELKRQVSLIAYVVSTAVISLLAEAGFTCDDYSQLASPLGIINTFYVLLVLIGFSLGFFAYAYKTNTLNTGEIM